MSGYEYKVVPAPIKGVKAKGVKTGEERFALALQELMNQMGVEGWEYQRAEALPSTERAGLTGTTTEWRNLLVFRRPLTVDDLGERHVHRVVSEAPEPPDNLRILAERRSDVLSDG